MDDHALALLRLRAHAAGLGVDWSRADDHAVIDFVAWALPGEQATAPALVRLAPKATAAAAAPPPAASSSRRSSPAAPAPAASQSVATPGPDVDAAATAQTLRQAAENGTPFCEECAREAAA